RTAEWHNVDLKTLREQIIPRDRPAVLKNLVAHWPLVRASAQSPQALLEYVRARDKGRPIRVLIGKPEIKGLYFYRDDLSGLNFDYASQPFHAPLASVLAHADHPDPPAIYTAATLMSDTCPDIDRENTLSILDRPARPRWWLGNKVTAATHYDGMDGIN